MLLFMNIRILNMKIINPQRSHYPEYQLEDYWLSPFLHQFFYSNIRKFSCQYLKDYKYSHNCCTNLRLK